MAEFIGFIWTMFFAWMPWQLQAAFFGFMAFAFIILIIRIVALILSAVPFL